MDIENILDDIEDSNEPACLAKIHLYERQLLEEDDLFMELLVSKLRGQMITWPRPWYQQSNSLSRPLRDEDFRKDDKSEQYRTDTISKAEHKKICQNWDEFIKLYELPNTIISLARWRNKSKSRSPNTPEELARRYAVAYLARGLQRTIYQVFRHINAKFGGAIKGPYSSAEEKIMRVCFEQQPKNCVTLLSTVLGREPRGIYKRLNEMCNGKPDKVARLKKTNAMATKLLNLLLDSTGLPLEELKYKNINNKVWEKIGEELNYPYVYLKKFWHNNLHVQLFVKNDIKLNRLRKNAFKKMKSSSYKVWTDIRWKEFVKEFPDGITAGFLYHLCVYIVQHYPKYSKKSLKKVADYALDQLKTKRLSNKRLKTLRFTEDRTLEEVRHNEHYKSLDETIKNEHEEEHEPTTPPLSPEI